MMARAGRNATANRWYCLVYAILFGLAYSQTPLFSSNQVTKFITGLALAGYRDVAADWMAGITDPFPLFSHLLKWQVQFLGLHIGVHLSFLLLSALYGLSGIWLAKTLLERDEDRRRTLLVFSFLWLVANIRVIRSFLWGTVPEGLAGQYMLGVYYQPCCFGVLLLAGIAAYISGRSLLAAICFVLAPLFHSAYLISSVLVAASMIVLPANRALGIGWWKRLLFLSLVVLPLAIYAVWSWDRLTAGDPLVRNSAHQILAEIRIPHHAIPSEWNLGSTVLFFLVGLAASWFGRNWLVGQLLFVTLVVVALTVVGAVILHNPTLAVSAPWRVSVFLAPLSWIILLAVAAKWLTRALGRHYPIPRVWLTRALVVAGTLAALAGLLGLVQDYQEKTHKEYYAISRFLEDYHESGNQYLIPLDQSYTRLEAGVPVYATWKSHPTKDSEFLEWYERAETVRAIYEGPVEQARQKLLALIEDGSVTHLMWRTPNDGFPFADMGEQVYRDNHFGLWDVRMASPE